MDYTKALFALEVQRMTTSYLKQAMPEGMSASDQQTWWKSHYAGAVKQVLADLNYTWTLIDHVAGPKG